METQVTLENLLDSALGEPEIGAVNFNYLHEVLRQILKQLGMLTKMATINEMDRIKRESESQLAIEKNQPQPRIESASDLPNSYSASERVIASDVTEPAESDNGDSKPTAELEDAKARSPSPPAEPKTTSSSHSRRQAALLTRNSSQKIKEGSSSNLSRRSSNELDSRRSSKTRAGDMWQQMNFNQRLEATEAALGNITGLIDTLTADVADAKDNITSIGRNKETPKSSDGSSDAAEKKFKDLSDMIGKLKADAKKFAMKDSLNGLCTIEMVEEIAAEQITEYAEKMAVNNQSSEANQPAESVIVQAPPVQSQPEPTSQPEPATQPKPPVQQEVVPRPSVPSLSQRRDSRVRLTQEALVKLTALEQSYEEVKDEIEQMKTSIAESKVCTHPAPTADGNAAMPSANDVTKMADSLTSDVKKLNAEVTMLKNDIEQRVTVIESQVSEDKNTLHDGLTSVGDQSKQLASKVDENQLKTNKVEASIEQLMKDISVLTDQMNDRPAAEFPRRQSRSGSTEDVEAMTKIRSTLFDVEASQSKFKDTIDSVMKEDTKKAAHIKVLYEMVDNLKADKVDQEFVAQAVAGKADAGAVDGKVNKKQFDNCVDGLDHRLQDVSQKLDIQESLLKQSVGKLQSDIMSKLNKDESGKMKNYIDERFKTYRPKLPEPKPQEETAAGFKKPVRNFHCISCDRPVELLQAGAIPSLPYTPPLPGTKSVRPYTTFDLEQIRQHMQKGWLSSNKDRFEVSQEREKLQKELLRLSGVQDFEELVASSARACGGTHTLLDAHRKSIIKASNVYQDEHVPLIQPSGNQLLETDLQGRDGHIYRGRSDELPPVKEACRGAKPTARGNSPIMARPSLQQSGSSFLATSQAAQGKVTE